MLKKTMILLVATLMAPVAFAGWQESARTNVPISGFEASGVVWDTYSGKLVLADDGGEVYSSDGARINVGGDLEGVATTGNGFVYVGTEGCNSTKPTIKELYAPPLGVTGRSWTLTDFPTPSSCNTGMEGLTWVPDGHHPYGTRSSGGVFYTSSMTDGKIYVFDVNLTFSGTQTTLLNPGGFTPLSGQTDISDIYYDPSQRLLFVLYDVANRLVQVDISKASPAVVTNGRLPLIPNNQEGVTFLPSCTASGTTTIYLSDDPAGNGYYSYSGFPGICASDPRKVETITLSAPLSGETSISYGVSITVRNIGTTTWAGSTFGLFSIGGPSTGVSLGASESVAPGQTKTFNFPVKFTSPGDYYLQWRMIQGNTWFGAPTPEVKIHVTDSRGICPRC